MTKRVTVEQKIQAKGHEIAQELRERFRKQGVFVVNLIGSPGAGKTSLLEAMAPMIKGRAAVIEGDLATDEDKQRVERAGMRAYQINTVGACHLDAAMVREALEHFPLDNIEILFIENVGNLVCPASFDVGEDVKVAVVSTTEGHDKPAKYPKAMRVASALVITKLDLAPHLDYDLDRVHRDIDELVPGMPVFETSAKTGKGLDPFLKWIAEKATAVSRW